MAEPFKACVTICGVYSEGLAIPEYQIDGEWWCRIYGVGIIPESKLIRL